MRHSIKCHPDPFEAVWNSQKTHEVRKNDRGYQVGDSLQLAEWEPVTETYTGRMIGATISYITHGGSWGIPDDLCVLSLQVFARKFLEPIDKDS